MNDDYAAEAHRRAEKMRLEALEKAANMSMAEKKTLISGLFDLLLRKIESLMAFSPSYLLLEYNNSYRERMDYALESKNFQAQVLLGYDILEVLYADDEGLEDALEAGDGDHEKFVSTLVEVGLLSHSVFGVLEAIDLQQAIDDIEGPTEP